MSTKILLILAVGSFCLHAQSEIVLRRAFEGSTVRVKIDLPATNEGVDIQYRGEPPLDFRSYLQRLNRFGVSLRNGDSVMVTAVSVKGKNIEFQLGGGGYTRAGVCRSEQYRRAGGSRTSNGISGMKRTEPGATR